MPRGFKNVQTGRTDSQQNGSAFVGFKIIARYSI